MAGLGNKLAATGGVKRRSSASPQTFTQKSGPRKGQRYTVKTGKSGLSVRKYLSGDTAIAATDSGVDVAAQRRDVAAGPPEKLLKARSLPQTTSSPSPMPVSSAQTQKRQIAALAKQYAGALRSQRRRRT
jgi:hypothetical protein